ncbi:MAG TPA: dihydroorotate dehydrogenase electron transfer subunit [Bacteroidales bacterium]|nr:dihydroorotate dehydrogenase electron transfer subunit [Bacteroidales bacterium]HPJ60847.1 dihydroorotate dehydrogenase electron transfer subunit [Bacteroidales bacterium]HPR12040.1 dihydroorotate dehydrogenase electron transfer subunit [Bacteroidales bacterium]HRW85915.1 dihydroorotate dehydrogenase electron transfer subunit [Bacteroidales bacterium]
MTKRIEDLIVTDNKRLNKEYFTLELTSSGPLPEVKPGQFAQIRIEGSQSTFLRRPFSIHDYDPSENKIRLLVQIVGKGTETLSRLKNGDRLNMIFPLGNSFSLPLDGQKPLLAGGGCGIAPLLFLARYLSGRGFAPEILLGFRNKERILEYDDYLNFGKVFITTEDGSEGQKGFLTDHPVLSSGDHDIVYCCGPEPMMKALACFCRDHDIECEVSLEHLMGCGIGACLCCVVDTVNGNLCTCTDGPVFNVNDLKW